MDKDEKMREYINLMFMSLEKIKDCHNLTINKYGNIRGEILGLSAINVPIGEILMNMRNEFLKMIGEKNENSTY